MKSLIYILTFSFCIALNAQTELECLNDSFMPIPGQTYLVSGWVKDIGAGQVTDYQGHIQVITLAGNATEEITLLPEGNVIEGWQRISKEITVPMEMERIEIKLISQPNGVSLFDDIRFFPFNGNMKSFVYDPINQRLMAELDENNYATLYEYDKEGGLVRVKKETERGVFTIQETRSGNSKLNN